MEKTTQPSKGAIDLNAQRQKEILKGYRMLMAVYRTWWKTDGVIACDLHTLLIIPCIYRPQKKDLLHKAFVRSSNVLYTTRAASSIRVWPEQGNVLALGPEQALYELDLLPVSLAGLLGVYQVFPFLSRGTLAKKVIYKIIKSLAPKVRPTITYKRILYLKPYPFRIF